MFNHLPFLKKRSGVVISLLCLALGLSIAPKLIPQAQAQVSSIDTQSRRQLLAGESIIRQSFGHKKESITPEEVENTISKMNAGQRSRLLAYYLSLDVDGDATLSKSELGAHNSLTAHSEIEALIAYEPPINIATMFKAANATTLKNGEGLDAKAIFKRFDKDQDGAITLQEYQAVKEDEKAEKAKAGAAQQASGKAMTQDEKDELAKLDIGRIIVRMVERGTTLPYTAGKLEKEAFKIGAKQKIAADRMRYLSAVLPFDIDGDGGLSQTERDRLPTSRALNHYPVIQEMSEPKGDYSYADLSAAADRLVIKQNEHLSDIDTLYAIMDWDDNGTISSDCLLYTSPSPRDATLSRMPSSA